MARKPLSYRAKTICERMRSSRINRDYTQEQIANHLEMKVNTYAAYERLEAEPSIDTIYLLCQFYGEKLDDWLGLTKNMTSFDPEQADMIAFEDDSDEPRQMSQEEATSLYNQILDMPPELFGEMKIIMEFLQWKYKYWN